MKFPTVKSDRRALPSREELCASKRLSKVAARTREEQSLYPMRPETPEAGRIKRLFWTPDEL